MDDLWGLFVLVVGAVLVAFILGFATSSRDNNQFEEKCTSLGGVVIEEQCVERIVVP